MPSATLPEPIAIIGMASQFAGNASDTDKLWDTLLNGRPSPSSFLNDKHYHPDQSRQGAIHAKSAYFIKDDTTAFDSAFFGITKKEVLSMDPQQRLLLESTYHALENAGITLQQAIGSNTSVFVGQCGEDFAAMCNSDMELAPTYKETGVERSLRANRISWFYDFKGASYVVDTACSSSLVALHTACQDLHLHDSAMAVVGGIALIDHPSQFMGLDKLGAVGSDGYCYTFDSRANGYARGEGVGTVILKRLADAVHDGNTIRAVIRSSNASSNGRTPGIFNPSTEAQIAQIKSSYQKACLDPTVTSFVEAHGTGTKAGDATEVKALCSAFETAKREAPLIIGAVKTILGHTEGAAGILSVIKVVKMLETGLIPRNHNFIKANPEIDLEKMNIRFPVETMTWPQEGIRRASINSFGFGGANAHAVMDDALSYLSEHKISAMHQTVRFENIKARKDFDDGSEPELTVDSRGIDHANVHSDGKKTYNNRIDEDRRSRLFVFSAFDKKSLSRTAESYKDWLQYSSLPGKKHSEFMDCLAFTLTKHRSSFNWRGYVTAGSPEELADHVSTLPAVNTKKQSLSLAFIFTGQGAQWDGMIGALSQFSRYRKSIEDAAIYFIELGSTWNLKDLLDHRVTLDKNDLALNLPLVTVLQVAIVDLLYSWGVKPRCVVGHSSGEVAAAYASGKIGRKAAWKIAYFRGVVAAKLSGQNGGMLAVALSPDSTMDHIREYEAAGRLTIACYNSPTNQTISGDIDAIDALKATLDDKNILARKLNVQNAYHSSHMAAGAEEYTRLLGDVHTDDKILACSDVEMISSVTGLAVTSKELEEASYWNKNLVSPVKFTSALSEMCNVSGISFDDLIEIGPHATLRSATKETLQDTLSASSSYHATVIRNNPSAITILDTAGSLWCKGYPIDLTAVNSISPDSARLLTNLPPYRFNHESSFLLESRLSSNYRFREYPRMDLIGAPVPDWDFEHPKWRQFFRVKETPWIEEHRITGQIVMAGAGWLVMAIEAAHQLADPALKVAGFRLREIALKSTLIIPETDEGVEVMISMQWMADSSETVSKIWREFNINSHDQESNTWRVHARGLISIEYEQSNISIDKDAKFKAEDAAARMLLSVATENCQNRVDSDWLYGRFKAAGCDFKKRYQNLSEISISDGPGYVDALGTVRNPDLTSVTAAGYVYPHIYHTVALDSVFHMGLPAIFSRLSDGTAPSATVPGWIDEVWISSGISSRAGDALKLCMHQDNDFWHGLKHEIVGFDEHTGGRKLHVKGLRYSVVPGHQLSSVLEPYHQITWQAEVNLRDADFTLWAAESQKLLSERNLIVVTTAESKQSAFCQLLAESFLASGVGERFFVRSLATIKDFDFSEVTCVVLSDGDDASLVEPSEETFQGLKHLLTVASRIFWVSTDTSKPQWAVASGLLKTARWEKGGIDTDFSLLSIVRSQNCELDSTRVLMAFQYHFFSGKAVRNAEYEIRGDTIRSNRISEHNAYNDFRQSHTSPAGRIILTPYSDDKKRHLRLKAQTPGRLETLHFVDDTDATIPLAPDEVEVKVAAVGLNFRDVVVGLGEQNEDVYGIEGAGIITQTGSDVTELKVGDRVTGVWSRNKGYMRSSCKIHHRLVTRIPNDMSFESAASVPVNFMTAIYSLREMARLSSGEKVLIHSGAGGTGQAAIQYAQLVGAEVFTTVSSEEKKKNLIDTYGIPADHIFSSRTLDFETLIMEATGGYGVDVVLNSLAGEALRRSLECVAPLGKFIELGKRDIYLNGRLPMRALKKSVAFFSVDMLTLFKNRENYSGKLLREVIDLVDKGTFKLPYSLQVYTFSDMLPAFRKLQTGNMMGKIVLTASDNDMVPTAVKALEPFKFHDNVSYIISGGLQGVGKAIAQWMVSHGARNLILFSRSGVQSRGTEAFIEQLRHSGCKIVASACDVADEDQLRTLLKSCKNMPPIRGCIQSAMVLRDKSIVNMTHEDWIAAIRPKVNGSWNLHQLLPTDLDFFVMLSSVTGVVGNHGQANYAAGNTFQDQLARHRVSLGLRATSLDLSAISGVGWIAEHSNIDTILRGASIQQIKPEDIFAALQYACNPSTAADVGDKDSDKIDQSQIIVGLDNASAIRRKGMSKPIYLDHALFSNILAEYTVTNDKDFRDQEDGTSLATQLSACRSLAAATELILNAIKQMLSGLISTPAEDIDERKTFSSYGVDSLVAVEFRSWLGAEAASDIAVLEIIGSRSIRSIAGKVAMTSKFVSLEEAVDS